MREALTERRLQGVVVHHGLGPRDADKSTLAHQLVERRFVYCETGRTVVGQQRRTGVAGCRELIAVGHLDEVNAGLPNITDLQRSGIVQLVLGRQAELIDGRGRRFGSQARMVWAQAGSVA